jgi:hypothetical protein
MNLLLKLIAILRVALPLPDVADAAAFIAWWNGLGPAVQEIIVALVDQFKTSGRVTLPLPDGTELILADSGRCMNYALGVVEAKLRAVPAEQWIAMVGPQAWGDGKFLQLFIQLVTQLLPIILPFFLTPTPTPEPGVL